MQSALMLSALMLSALMLSVLMMNVVMLRHGAITMRIVLVLQANSQTRRLYVAEADGIKCWSS